MPHQSDMGWSGSFNKGMELLVVGVCMENMVGSGQGPALRYASPERLRSFKLTHPEVVHRIKELKEEGLVSGGWVWNTCNRFEVYVLHQGDSGMVADYVLRKFFPGCSADDEDLNVFQGEDVVHHVLRTVVGLNSGLPGETDVEGQFLAAIHMSENLEFLGQFGAALTSEILVSGTRTRSRTQWEGFKPNYCQAALEGVFKRLERSPLGTGPIAVVGSSTTSRTCVDVLENHFGVHHQDITVYHRCHGKDGQMKSIRRVSNGCNRERVEDYSGPEVLKAVAGSSLAILGIDRDRPILVSEQLEPLVSERATPLVCVDFNTFGSTQGLDSLENVRLFVADDLDREVRDYAFRMTRDPAVCDAIGEIEPLLKEEALLLADRFFAPEGDCCEGCQTEMAVSVEG